jgi:hypothetical protein
MHGLAHKIEAGLDFRGNWTDNERKAVQRRLDKLPPALTRDNPALRTIERKKVLKPKPPGAPGDSKYIGPTDQKKPGTIVLYDRGVYDGRRQIDKENLSRSVFHELAHSLDHELPGVFEQWKAISAWTQRNGAWVAQRPGAGFVDDYAMTSPFEDWAETFQEYFIQPAAVKKRVPEKHRFIERFLAAAKRHELTKRRRPCSTS